MTLEQELDALLAQTLVEIDAFKDQIVEKRRCLAEIKRLMREREEQEHERRSHLTPVRPPSVSDMRAARETAEAFGNANQHSEKATIALKPLIPKPRPER